MKKLRMSLDDLSVESFDALPDSVTARGTVRGRDESLVAAETTMDDSNCPIASCGCSDPGQRFTECDCETVHGGWVIING